MKYFTPSAVVKIKLVSLERIAPCLHMEVQSVYVGVDHKDPATAYASRPKNVVLLPEIEVTPARQPENPSLFATKIPSSSSIDAR